MVCGGGHSVIPVPALSMALETVYLDSIPKPSIFDSVIYQSVILSNGKIQTGLKDSVRFTRLTHTK